MPKFLAIAAVAAILAVPTSVVFAQDQTQGQMPMQGQNQGNMMQGQGGAQMPMMRMMDGMAPTQSAQGYMNAMQQMMQQMTAMEMTGDADTDFAKAMIPHHQSVVAMAQVELKNGKDEGLKKMAQAMIDAQQREIEELQQWLAAHGKK